MNTIVRGASLYQTQSNPVWDKWAFDARKRFSDPIPHSEIQLGHERSHSRPSGLPAFLLSSGYGPRCAQLGFRHTI